MAEKNKPLVRKVQTSIFNDSEHIYIDVRDIETDDIIASQDDNDLVVIKPTLTKPLRDILAKQYAESLEKCVYWQDYVRLINDTNEKHTEEIVDLLTCMEVKECNEHREYRKAEQVVKDIDAEIKHLRMKKVIAEQNLYDMKVSYLLDLYASKEWVIFGMKIPDNIKKEINFRLKRNATKRKELEYVFSEVEL